MRTERRTEATPWQAIDLMTVETLGWYSTEMQAVLDNPLKPIDTFYRPKRKRK